MFCKYDVINFKTWKAQLDITLRLQMKADWTPRLGCHLLATYHSNLKNSLETQNM